MSDPTIDQPALWTEPVWTDTYTVGQRVHADYHTNDTVGTVAAVDPGRSVTVRFTDHPRHGTYETRFGSPFGLRPTGPT